MKKILLSISFLSCFGIASAQVSASAGVRVEVLTPATMAKTQDLSISNIRAFRSRGILNFSASGKLLSRRGIRFSSNGGRSLRPASFLISGDNACIYDVMIADAPITISSEQGAITVDKFTTSTLGQGPGVQLLNVGARLKTKGRVANGSYSADDFNITIHYN